MGEIEAKEGVLQLHHDNDFDHGRPFRSCSTPSDHGLSHRHGNYVNPRTGRAAAVDLTLCKSPMDVGKLNLDWVHNTRKHLFIALSKHERHLLYCVYARDMDWEGISSTFNMNIREAKKWHQAILEKLQEKVKGVPLDAPEVIDLEALGALVLEDPLPSIFE